MPPPISFKADLVNTVSLPASPPGARSSIFNWSGFAMSTPVRFLELFSTSSFVETISIDFGVLYFLPLVFPLPARICLPLAARRTSS